MKDFSKKIALLLLLPCVFSSTGRAQVPDEINLNKELVAFYPFNGNDDDESGNGNDLKSSGEENAFSFDRNVHPIKQLRLITTALRWLTMKNSCRATLISQFQSGHD